MLDAALPLRVVVLQLLLDRNDDEWNGQRVHFDDMYSSLKEKATQYNDFLGLLHKVRQMRSQTQWTRNINTFYHRVKKWLHLSKIIDKEFENKLSRDEWRKNTTWVMAPMVGGVVVAAVIFTVVLVVYLMYLQS